LLYIYTTAVLRDKLHWFDADPACCYCSECGSWWQRLGAESCKRFESVYHGRFAVIFYVPFVVKFSLLVLFTLALEMCYH